MMIEHPLVPRPLIATTDVESVLRGMHTACLPLLTAGGFTRANGGTALRGHEPQQHGHMDLRDTEQAESAARLAAGIPEHRTDQP